MPDDLLTTRDVQTLARVSRGTVVRWRETGQLPTIKVGKLVRFRRADVDALLSPVDPTPTEQAS